MLADQGECQDGEQRLEGQLKNLVKHRRAPPDSEKEHGRPE
jgi:hypothetical protein